jgi:hypothetical protein
MKTKLKLTTTILLALFASPLAFAADEHDHSKETAEEHHEHDESVTKGPNGGHVVISKAGFSFEITTDKDNKPVALTGQAIAGISGERSAPTKLTFAKGKEKDADVLISDKPLPAGAHVPMILTIKTAPDAKAVTERFELHLH